MKLEGGNLKLVSDYLGFDLNRVGGGGGGDLNRYTGSIRAVIYFFLSLQAN